MEGGITGSIGPVVLSGEVAGEAPEEPGSSSYSIRYCNWVKMETRAQNTALITEAGL